MSTQPTPRSAWRWITIVTALIFVAIVAWRVNASASPSPAPQPAMAANMPGMTMGSGQAPAVTAIPNAPTMALTMPGMDMRTQQAPTATPAEAGQGSAYTAIPGMDMGGGLMQDAPVSSVGVPVATEHEGGQFLPFKLDGNVKVFAITARPVVWKINADTQVIAWTYNGTLPSPLICVTEGDQVRVVFTNQLPKPTTIHWRGLPVPNKMDGVPPLTQEESKPGASFTYAFEARLAGTFMYHSHVDTDKQINIGLFGGFIVDPKNWAQVKPDVDATMILNEWRIVDGKTYPAMPTMGEPNFFTINGKTFPDTQTNVKQGQRVRIRFIGAGQFEHPMHLHGMPFKIVATDGYPVPEVAQLTKDVIPVHPGERFDVEFVADNPGQWAFHCHIVHHVTNNDVEPGGLLFVVNVQE